MNHKPDGSAVEGGHKTISVAEAPQDVVDIGVRAANLIGDGFYGVPDPKDPRITYSSSQFLGLQRNDTKTWQVQDWRAPSLEVERCTKTELGAVLVCHGGKGLAI